MLSACKKEAGSQDDESTESSQTLTLKASANDAEDLQIQLKGGTKSASAEEFSSSVSPGDTIFWTINDNSNIKSIMGIRLVESDCDNLFKDGIIFNDDSTSCYGVISEDAFGSAKYDIGYIYVNGDEIWVDPQIDVDPVE